MGVVPWLWNPSCRILAVESWLWHPVCGILVAGSLLWNPGRGFLAVASWFESVETTWEHLGHIWEASGRHLGGIWEASGRRLVARSSQGRPEAGLDQKVTKIVQFCPLKLARPTISHKRDESKVHFE